MRQPDELDYIQLAGWVDKQPKDQSITIVSETYGPLCGFVPNRAAGHKRYTLLDGWFDPYKRGTT